VFLKERENVYGREREREEREREEGEREEGERERGREGERENLKCIVGIASGAVNSKLQT
jgi:hypothetical protein